MYRFPIKLETEAKGCYNMINWKIGEVFLKDYCLKISCAENVESLMQDKNEKTYRIVLFKKGTTILNVNGKSIAITAPSVCCISDRDQFVCMNQDIEYNIDVIYFYPGVINDLFNFDNVITGEFDDNCLSSVFQDRSLLLTFYERNLPYAGCFPVEVNTFHRLLQLFKKLQNQLSMEVDCYWPCRSRSYLIEILIILQMRYLDHSSGKEFLELNETQQEMNVVLEYIHSNYSSKITIDMLSKQFHINRTSLNKRFQILTGYTPISYLIEHRLKVAESLLVNTKIPVHEICDRVGFGELSNFMRSFKRKYGQTPANYRTQYTMMQC